jgi:hypothetical protein
VPDEFEPLDELTDKLVASPALLGAWRASCAIETSYAWHLLNHSWQLSPELPLEYIPHNPRLRLWDDAGGWTDNDPYTLTVFHGLDGPARCRHAIWHCNRSWNQRFIQFFDDGGRVQFYEPNITFTDTDVPLDQLNQHLQTIAAYKVPAIPLQDPRHHSVTTDVGSVGFEYFSQNQPPAGVKYGWSDYTPSEWEPLISAFERLRELLLKCFG